MSDILQIKTLGELTRIVDGFYLNNSGDELTKTLLDFYDKQWISVDGLVAELQKRIHNIPIAKFRWQSHEFIGYDKALKEVLKLLEVKKKNE